LTARDFDALRAASPADERRAQLVRRAIAWAKGVARRLGDDGPALDVRADVATGEDQHAAVWVGLVRGDAADEAGLGVRVDGEGVELRLTFHARALEQEVVRARLASALPSLPEQFTARLGDAETPSRDVTRASLDTWSRASPPADLRVGWIVPRATAIAHADLLDEQLGDALVALAGLRRVVASPPEAGRRPSRGGVRPRRRAAATTPIERGDRVRVRSGPFAEKVGHVSELDGRGGARVMLGLLSTHFDLTELEPVAAPRASFQSSHRRPIPPPKAR
jgi:hypothetical protein